jgi:hypothetical protein
VDRLSIIVPKTDMKQPSVMRKRRNPRSNNGPAMTPVTTRKNALTAPIQAIADDV